ncbi:MAG: carboxypeptidase regulatory-like domain-containing protein [Saprospiraceae bacterium]
MRLTKWSFLAVLLTAGVSLFAQSTRIQGVVKDKDTGEPLISAAVKVFKGTDLVTGAVTDFDGAYSINLDPGKYDFEASYSGNKEMITGVTVLSGKVADINFKISSDVKLAEIEIIVHKVPIIDKDATTTAKTITAEDIKNLGTRNINTIASTVSGVSSVDNGAVTIRGSRSDGTVYYLDGIRINGRAPAATDIEQVTVIKGGLDPQYGDVTGGIIGLITKGPSSKFSGGIEGETSNGLDPYGYTFLNANVSGPILKKDGRSVIGFRLSGQYTELKDDDPPAFGEYFANEASIARLSQDPITLFKGALTPNAAFLKSGTDINFEKYNLNDKNKALDMTGKLDFKPSQNIDFTLSGTYSNVQDRFVPDDTYIGSGSWRLLNWINNPTTENNVLRGNLRLRHRLGRLVDLNAPKEEGAETQKLSSLQNASYTIQLGYQNRKGKTQDFRHEDRFFEYGHVGNFNREWFAIFDQNNIHVGFIPLVTGFNGDNSANPIFARYNKLNTENSVNLESYRAFNSNVSSTFNTVWSGLATNVGSVYNNYNKFDNDQLTAQISSSFDFLPNGSSKNGRHNIQFGILLEQSVNRNYTVRPFDLWKVGRLYANQHIVGIDPNTICYYDSLGRPVFCNIIDTAEGAKFYKSLRELIYPGLNQAGQDSVAKVYANIDGIDPSKLSLSMFSPTELTEQSLIGYNGYDYLGNKLGKGVKFEDFFLAKDANGNKTYDVAPFSPIYAAGYVGDKFIYKDIIFRIGGRVDYYDGNTKVLRDPYSLYGILGAKSFGEKTGTQIPTTIGDDFKTYVNSEGSKDVKAYRDGDQWYFPNGTAANNSLAIFGENNLVYPAYIRADEKTRSIRGKDFGSDNINESFEDYKPEINFMPRIAFSFPISDEANFFAHYDILVQRPTSNQFASALSYYYFDIVGRTPSENGSLKPSKKIDYEVGFQQKITENSALSMSAYYNELRDMIQITTLSKVATVGTYNTYRNIDFGTVKGFNFSYDLRRVNNFDFTAAYTLQFADGTGSDPDSQKGLTGKGINIRNIFPFTYDERHRFSFTTDYRYGHGKQYNGPRIAGKNIFEDAGLNIQLITASGRPYSQGLTIVRFDGSGYRGDINGSRLPWNFNIDIKADKNFTLTRPEAKNPLSLNVYIRCQNLLDTRNVIGLYRGSGDAKDDGYLTSDRGKNDINSVVQTYGKENLSYFTDAYNWALLNPDNFTLPRRIYIGAIFEF